MVKYQVQYKPINPVTNTPVTNTTLSEWNGAVSSSGGFNPNHDMALMYIRTNPQAQIAAKHFTRTDGEVWAVFAVKESIKAAMKVAKPLIQEYGVDNVQICKVVQANIDIIFEEGQ